MGEFFKPLRRKIGVVALLLACASMSAWVRSRAVTEILYFPGRKHFTESEVTVIDDRVLLERGFISLERTQAYYTGRYFDNGVREELRTWRRSTSKKECFFCDERYWKWRMLGFGYCEMLIPGGVHYLKSEVVIPLWSITTPLTLLSAWLLISRKQVATTS